MFPGEIGQGRWRMFGMARQNMHNVHLINVAYLSDAEPWKRLPIQIPAALPPTPVAATLGGPSIV